MQEQTVQRRIAHLFEHALPKLRHDHVRATLAALSVFVAATASRFAIDHFIPPNVPFFAFFSVGVVIATLVGGMANGILVLILSVFVSWYFFVTPRLSLAIDQQNAISVLAFIALSGLLVVICGQLNATVEKLLKSREDASFLLQQSNEARQEVQLLNGELQHRIKNIFAVVGAILKQMSRYQPDSRCLVESAVARLHAMSRGQEVLSRNNFMSANLRALIDQTLVPLAPSVERLQIVEFTAVNIGSADVTTAVLVLHELGTNCLKHGAWSDGKGVVVIRLTSGPDDVVLEWTEVDGPVVGVTNRQGFGSTLFKNLLPAGSWESRLEPSGLRALARFKTVEAEISLGSKVLEL